jgi:hypothetical protein
LADERDKLASTISELGEVSRAPYSAGYTGHNILQKALPVLRSMLMAKKLALHHGNQLHPNCVCRMLAKLTGTAVAVLPKAMVLKQKELLVPAFAAVTA